MITSSILDLRKFVAPEFLFGKGAVDLAGQYAWNLGGRRVLVVTDPGVQAAGWADRVLTSLNEAGIGSVVYNKVSPNPRDYEVMEGSKVYLENGCDSIVVVGGGSPMDLAKGVGIVISNNKHILEFEGVDNVEIPGPPLICIPTTAGSSADVSQFAIITDTSRKVKIAIVSKSVVADVALIDPETTVSMSRELTADTGLDALTHSIEAFVSSANSPMTDIFALEAIKCVHENLLTAVEKPENLEARAGQMLGSMYAGLAFSNAILGAVHAMAHSLGGLLDLPHGECNAILLDHVVGYNYPKEPGRYARIGRALGADIPLGAEAESQEVVTGAIRAFKHQLGVSSTLGELGMKEEDIEALARNALADPCMSTNPRQPSLEDIMEIFRSAM